MRSFVVICDCPLIKLSFITWATTWWVWGEIIILNSTLPWDNCGISVSSSNNLVGIWLSISKVLTGQILLKGTFRSWRYASVLWICITCCILCSYSSLSLYLIWLFVLVEIVIDLLLHIVLHISLISLLSSFISKSIHKLLFVS